MTKGINRRQFLYKGLAGAAALTAGFANLGCKPATGTVVDRVTLGGSGLVVPRIAMGTGTVGGQRESNQTRLGMQKFIQIARHAHDRGVGFFDMADLYGSHSFVREFLKEVPRDETCLLTKVWTLGGDWFERETMAETLDRFRLETGSDYFDIFMLHCLVNDKWQEDKRYYIDAISKAKEDGIIKATGVSCHNFDALRQAAEDPWVDVIMARINPFGIRMDGPADDVMQVLETARQNGKGIIGMKIFGQGDITTDSEREQSLRYAVDSPNIHCMTLGFETTAHVDWAVDRVTSMIG